MDVFRRAYTLVNPEQQRPKEWYEELEEQFCQFCPSLTWEQRITGCLLCIVIGFILSMGSTIRIVELLKGRPESFAVMYTIGNVIGMCSTCFLYGPWSQLKKMFAPTRLIASCAYFFFMGLTLFLAFYPHYIVLRALWLSLSILCQFLALTWYTLSYIPFARQMVLSCFRQTCCRQSGNSSSMDSDDGWGL